jgi:hypothetical protein
MFAEKGGGEISSSFTIVDHPLTGRNKVPFCFLSKTAQGASIIEIQSKIS